MVWAKVVFGYILSISQTGEKRVKYAMSLELTTRFHFFFWHVIIVTVQVIGKLTVGALWSRLLIN